MPTYEKGRIIWAVIEDRNGYAKPERRPAMVLQTVTENSPDDEIPVVVGSTRDVDAGRDDCIVIDPTPSNKLRQKTVFVCSWTATVKCRDAEWGGFLRGYFSAPIAELVFKLNH